jgi:electron transfer flavoprotein alpha subunit
MSTGLVIVEQVSGAPRRSCLEALGRVRSIGLETIALVAGRDPSAVAQAAAPFADRVLAAAHEDLERYNADALVPLAARIVSELSPVLVLAPATHAGRDLAARLSARIDAPCAAEVTDLTLGDDGRPRAVRPVHGGKVLAEIGFRGGGPVVATVRGNAFSMPDPGSPGSVESVDPGVDPASLRTRVASVEEATGGRVGVTEAQIVVSGGRGMGDPSNFALLEKLADRLGAAVGASRAVVDAGWRDASSQVGKSGNTVAPRLYVAFGISGAVHHVMGMDGSGTVVVVNKDENALFFEHADHGLQADALEVLPALLEELGEG